MGTTTSTSTDLHRILRTLCLNTEWKYAVFWKLKHRARMVLTLEDAYYDKHEQQDCSENGSSNGHYYSHDPLELALAKMSCHVYSLGEGIVGQVAVTGKYQWIFADMHVMNSCLSFEYCDGWQTQFSAGIRTIVVVPVVPQGVVQLGSLNKVTEDMKLVTRIRDVFLALQDSSVGHIPSPIQCSMKNSLSLQDIPTNSLASDVIPDCLRNLDKAINKERPDVWLSVFPYFGNDSDSFHSFPLHGIHHKKADMVNKHEGLELSALGGDETTKLHLSKSNIINLEHQKLIGMREVNDMTCGGVISGCKDKGVGLDRNVNSLLHSPATNKIKLCDVTLPSDKVGVDFTYLNSDLLDSAVCDRYKLDATDFYENGVLHIHESSDMKFQQDLEKLDFQTESSHMDILNTSLNFPAGCELQEALGPAFMKNSSYIDSEAKKTKDRTALEMPEGMSSSQLTSDSHPDHLLEAVVATVCQSGTDVKSEKSFCKPLQSLSTSEINPEPSSHTTQTITSAGYSFEQPSFIGEEKRCLSSSGLCGAISATGFSSNCPSTCSEQLERSSEPVKNNKKRARPGENSRPRPRDRQLIQDRIKELRELVPNGSKCSIDSLLERTIKHMLFLQGITKHADKLNKCANSKLRQKESGMVGSSSYEHGSSLAVEVGGHLKVCSIIVENLNKNGQMLVEMLCEECSHFLEIAEAIRSLDLTILKGVTEAHGEKTWICFVVEGQTRNIPRMEILWSLVQILQPNKAMQQ